MIWTITWVTVVALVLTSYAVVGLRTDRSIGGVVIAAAAFGWAFVRWAWIDVNWLLIRPLGGGWVLLTLILLVASLVIAFVWWRVAKLIGGISLIVAVFTPYAIIALLVGVWLAVLVDVRRRSSRRISPRVRPASRRSKNAIIAPLVVALIVAAVVGAFMVSHDTDGSPSADPTGTPSASPSDSASPTPTETITAAPEGLDEDKLAKSFAHEFKNLGFRPGEVSVGTVDWEKNPIDHRQGAFGDGVKSQAELTEFLNSDTPRGTAARQHILNAVPKSEHERVLNGENFIPVQYNVNIQYGGNATWVNDKLVRGGKVVAEDGDVFYVFVGEDYKIYWDASVRSDCENPGANKPPRPVRPPPGGGCVRNCNPQPPCIHNCHPQPPKCVEIPGNGVVDCGGGKDPSQDPAAQGNAPQGGGHNDTNGPGSPNPSPTFPSTPHTNPPAPQPSGPPSGSTPAPSSPPPPVESGANPPGGGGSGGDPGGF